MQEEFNEFKTDYGDTKTTVADLSVKMDTIQKQLDEKNKVNEERRSGLGDDYQTALNFEEYVGEEISGMKLQINTMANAITNPTATVIPDATVSKRSSKKTVITFNVPSTEEPVGTIPFVRLVMWLVRFVFRLVGLVALCFLILAAVDMLYLV